MKDSVGLCLTMSRVLSKLIAGAAAGALLFSTAPVHAEEKPFEPAFEVSSALRTANEPTQVQIFFELKEGNAFPTKAVLEIPGAYQIPRGSGVPNGDIVGDGIITIKTAALGKVTVNVCLSNRNPPRPGDWATINVAVQLGNTTPTGCTGLLNLTLGLKHEGEGTPYTATLELPSSGGLGLDTPVQLTVNLFGVSRPDPQSVPPAPGNAEVLKNPATPGIYEWKLTVQDAAGRTKQLTQPQRIDMPPPRPSETGKKFTRWASIAGGVAAALLLLAAIVVLARRKARKIYEEVSREQAWLQDFDYFEGTPRVEEEVGSAGGYITPGSSEGRSTH